MYRRTFAIALLTAVFCCTLSVPRADEPPSDSLAKYLPAGASVLVEVPDLGGLLKRSHDLAVAKVFEEKGLLQAILDSHGAAGGPRIHLDAFSKAVAELAPGLSSTFTGRAELAVVLRPDQTSATILSFRVAEGREVQAAAAVEEIAKRLVEQIVTGVVLAIVRTDYAGAKLLALSEAGRQSEENIPWLCAAGGYCFLTTSKQDMCTVLDLLAAPTAQNLLGLPAYRSAYASVAGCEIRGYVSICNMLRNSTDFRGSFSKLVGGEKVSAFDSATLAFGASLKGLVIEDEYHLGLGGKQWAFPADLFPEAPCKAASASIFPGETVQFFCLNLNPAGVFRFLSSLPGCGEEGLTALKQRGIDIEAGLLPLIGTEFAVGNMGVLPSQNVTCAVELKNASAAREWFANLANVANDAFESPAEVEGGSLYPMRSPGLFPYFGLDENRTAFAVKGNWLLYGPEDTIRNQVAGKAPSLAANLDFVESVPPILSRQPKIVAFLNMRLLNGNDMIQKLIVGYMGKRKEITAAIPDRDRMSAWAAPTAIGVNIAPDGGSLFSTGPMGPYMLLGFSDTMWAFPGLAPGRGASEISAYYTCLSFGGSAASYTRGKADQCFWGSGTTDFTPHFTHVSPKRGYRFRYFSDSTAPDKEDAVKYVYLAVPISFYNGGKAYYVDESQIVYTAIDPARGNTEVLTSAQVTALNAFMDKAASVPNWGVDDAARLGIPGVEFIRK